MLSGAFPPPKLVPAASLAPSPPSPTSFVPRRRHETGPSCPVIVLLARLMTTTAPPGPLLSALRPRQDRFGARRYAIHTMPSLPPPPPGRSKQPASAYRVRSRHLLVGLCPVFISTASGGILILPLISPRQSRVTRRRATPRPSSSRPGSNFSCTTPAFPRPTRASGWHGANRRPPAMTSADRRFPKASTLAQNRTHAASKGPRPPTSSCCSTAELPTGHQVQLAVFLAPRFT